MEFIIMLAVLFVIVLLTAVSCIKIVPQAHAAVVECLGAYRVTWNVGIHFKRPFLDRVARRINLKPRFEISSEIWNWMRR